jgi:hypothetical protein
LLLLFLLALSLLTLRRSTVVGGVMVSYRCLEIEFRHVIGVVVVVVALNKSTSNPMFKLFSRIFDKEGSGFQSTQLIANTNEHDRNLLDR